MFIFLVFFFFFVWTYISNDVYIYICLYTLYVYALEGTSGNKKKPIISYFFGKSVYYIAFIVSIIV